MHYQILFMSKTMRDVVADLVVVLSICLEKVSAHSLEGPTHSLSASHLLVPISLNLVQYSRARRGRDFVLEIKTVPAST